MSVEKKNFISFLNNYHNPLMRSIRTWALQSFKPGNPYFLFHIDFHMVFAYSKCKKKKKGKKKKSPTSQRYTILGSNVVWSNIGNYLEPVICMVSNRCPTSAFFSEIYKLSHGTHVTPIGVPGQLGTKSRNLSIRDYQGYLIIKEAWKRHAILSSAVYFIYCVIYFQVFF